MRDWMPPPPAFFSPMNNDETLTLSSVDEPKTSSFGALMERRAAKAGFSASRLNTESIRSGDISKAQEVQSPYLTIPPGLSPTTLLDSPVMLTNSLAQPSPTTGKFFSGLSGNHRNSTLISDDHDDFKNNTFKEATSFAFKPIPESGSTHNFNQKNEVRTSCFAPQSFPTFGISTNSNNNSSLYQCIEPSKSQTLDTHRENSPYLDEPREDDGDQKSGSQAEDDGYNWRKYGQKQVKGSEYPRSYYKCTHPNCPVKKKVERSYEGYVTEIIYKGDHSHPKPNGSGEILPLLEPERNKTNGDGDLVWSVQECSSNGGGPRYEAADVVEGSCTFSNDGDGGRDDDRVTHGSLGLSYDGEGDESESKRRRIETYASEISGATRAISEPRIVVQTTSEVDILDDGFRWRKYGQKVVKGNPNPRSYYKCTSQGCNVRKHVERASNDLASVITTYEGKHNHEVPVARNSSHANSNGPSTLTTQQAASTGTHLQRPDPSQMHSNVGRFNRNSLGSFGFPGRAPGHGFGPGLNQQGLSNLGLAGLGHDQGKLAMMQGRPYMGGQIRPMGNNAGFVLPKREPKLEPVVDSSLNSTGGSAVYQQVMSQLPLGPNM